MNNSTRQRSIVAIAIALSLIGILLGGNLASASPLSQTCTSGYTIWANTLTLDISGSTNQIQGMTRSNSNILLSGSNNTFTGRVEYVTTFNNSGGGNVFSGGTFQVAASAAPLSFNIADYAPGGSKAVAAGANYHFVNGNYTFTAADVAQGGLWYINGNAFLSNSNLVSPAMGITIVSTGLIDVSGSTTTLTPYVDGLLLFSNKLDSSSSPVIKVAGSNHNWRGHIYAPRGMVEFSGSVSTFRGTVIGDRVRLNGSNLTFIFDGSLCPPPTNTPTNTPVPSTNTPTNTSVPPTNTSTNTPTNTPVPPTNTATDTPTNTPVPPTDTSTNTPTDIPTNTATDIPTNTPVPPTNTSTNTPTRTNTPTDTPIPPTATPTDTNTPTNTPVPPTNTSTNTPTKTSTPTRINTPTNTPSRDLGGLTPGYWKNHLTEARAFLPISLGTYSVDTTTKVTKVFSAMNCSSSKPNDAIGCLAGHLLAAELNVANGANACIQPVINQADAFLSGQTVNGVPGINYVGPTGKYTLTTAQRNLAISLKNLLDKFNNNISCP